MLRNKRKTMDMLLSSKWAILLLPLAILGCANDIPMLTIDSVSLYADLDANQNSATPIDLVLVYDPEVNKMISSLSAAKYFQNSQQLQRDNPTALDVWHWELVPGQSVIDFQVNQSKGDAYDGYVFANYLSPGDHRLKVAPSGLVKILLLKTDMKDLALLNVQNVTQGVTSPTPLNAPTVASQAHQQDKSKQIGRSTADFKDFDMRAKDEEPDSTPPYLFQVPGVPNEGGLSGPIDLRPEDSKKGQGDTNLIFPGNPVLGYNPQGVPPSSSDSTPPCASTPPPEPCEDTIYDSMPYHGPETVTHTHGHLHEVTATSECGETIRHQIAHSHEHGHPHPLVGGGEHTISSTELEPPHGISH